MSVAKTSVGKTSVAKAPDEVVGLGGADRPVVGVAGLGVEVAELDASKLLTARNQTRRPVLAASGLERSLMMSRYQPMRPIVEVIRPRLHRLTYPRIRFV